MCQWNTKALLVEYTFQSDQKKPMVGPGRPQIVLFGSSIVQYSFSDGGWGATLANIYSRTVCDPLSLTDLLPCKWTAFTLVSVTS